MTLEISQDMAVENSEISVADIPEKVRCFFPSETVNIAKEPLP